MNCRDHAFKWRINGYSPVPQGGGVGKRSSPLHTLVPFSYSGLNSLILLIFQDQMCFHSCIALPNLSSFLLPLFQAESTIFLGISAFQLLLLFSDACIDLSVFLFLISWFCFFHSDLLFIPLSYPLFCLLSLFICFSLCFCPIDYCSVSFCLSLRSLFFLSFTQSAHFSLLFCLSVSLGHLSFLMSWPPPFIISCLCSAERSPWIYACPSALVAFFSLTIYFLPLLIDTCDACHSPFTHSFTVFYTSITEKFFKCWNCRLVLGW